MEGIYIFLSQPNGMCSVYQNKRIRKSENLLGISVGIL